jgi:two-component system, chemotaxis family, protein-glutamate methylesterase/glutaminase
VDDGAAEYGMANRDVLAIGTSAGGVEALSFLANSFRPDFPAAILVTIHLPTQFRSSFDEILSRAGPVRAEFANDGQVMKKARITSLRPVRTSWSTASSSCGAPPRRRWVSPALPIVKGLL